MKPTRAALAGLAAAVAACALTAWHIRRHLTPPSFDEAWYLEVSFRLWNTLSEFQLLDFVREYSTAFRFKAPLISLLPLPLYALMGPSYEAARLANLPAMGLLAASLYGLGRKFFSPAAGALAAALALALPMTAALSKIYFVELWLTAFTAAFLWRWAESETLRDRAEAPRLGALAGLGMLTKVLFPLAIIGPLALTLRERKASFAELEAPLKVLFAVASALALTWYGPNLVYIAGYTVRASAGDIAAHYAVRSPLHPLALLGYWNAMAHDGFSYAFVLMLAGALWALGAARVRAEPGLRFALAWLLPPLLVASLGQSKELRFAAAALPGAALALAGALDILTRGRPGRSALFAAAIAVTVVFSPSKTVYGGPPSQTGQWEQAALVSEVAGRVGGGAVVAMGAEHLYLNANILSAEAARVRAPHSYVHYGHMQSKVEAAVARLSDKDVTHILFVSGLPAEVSPSIVAVDAQLKSLVAAGKLPFRSAGRLAWAPSGLSAELFERTGPIRMTGAATR